MTTKADKKEIKDNKKKRPLWKRALKLLGILSLAFIILFTVLVLFVRSPWGQSIIVGQLTSYISSKTKTTVAIEKLFITFSGAIELQGLYLEDKNNDTLIYSDQLQVDIPLLPIIQGNPIAINGLEWKGLRANVHRKDSINGFNYQFLIDAFASDTTTVETENTEPLKIAIGSINFSDFEVNYNDVVSGMNANLSLGNFHFEGKSIDLEKMKFEIADMLLENTAVNYIQTKPSLPSEPPETALPYLSLDNLNFKNVVFHYQSDPDSVVADLTLADLTLQVPKADLSQQDILVSQFNLNNSDIKVQLNSTKKTEIEPTESTKPIETTTPFVWPTWDVKVESIALQNNNIQYQVGKQINKISEFNPDYIVLNDFNFKATAIELSKNKSAKLNLENISFKEHSGLTLNQLAFAAALNPNDLSINALIIKTGNSSLNADIKAQFSSLQDFIDGPEAAPLILNLKQFSIDLNDAFEFEPALKKNEYLVKLANHQLTGQVRANGQLAKLNFSEVNVNWGENTKINTHGELNNVLDLNQLEANIDNFTFSSTRSDLSNFVTEETLGISIPKSIQLETQFNGKLTDFKTKTQLIIPEGKIKINGQFKQTNTIAFNAKVNVVDLKLGKVLNNPNIGTVAFVMNAKGKGTTINNLNAQLVSEFSKLELNGYDFSALQLNGELTKGNGAIVLNYKDENLDLKMKSNILMDPVSPKIALDFNLEGADLLALGFSEKDVKTKLKVKANFEGNSEAFEFESHFSEGLAVYENENYHLGAIDLSAGIQKDSTTIDITSNFLNGKLRSNSNPEQIAIAIQHQLKSYFADSVGLLDTTLRPVQLKLNMQLSETKLITEYLAPEIKAMDTLQLNIDFNQVQNILTTNLSLPYIDYAGNTLDSLKFNINSVVDNAEFKFGFNKLEAAPVLMNRTYFDGDFNDGLLNLHLHTIDNEKEMYVIKTEITGKSSDLKVHINPEELILQGEPWSIPIDNEISFQTAKIEVKNFILSQNEQSIRLANDLEKTTQENIGIEFTNFKLANLLALFNKDELLASGNLQGNIVALDPFEKLGLSADFNIEDLTALQTEFGTLSLKANSESNDKYNLDLGIKGNDIDLNIEGDYSLQNVGSELDFNLNLNEIGMKTIASLSGESLKDASGSISGEIAVQGKISDPKYKGFLTFNETVFNVSQLNSEFRLANDKIKIDNSDITLTQFSIQDNQNNTFTLNGSISTKNTVDPAFNLSLKAKNFQALSSTKKDNELFYGSVNFDVNGILKGKLSAPKVDMNIGVNESTNFTYVLQDSQAELETSDGIVEFVNKKNPDNILTRTTDSTNVALFEGLELKTKIKIDKGAKFNVIIDPKTGDNLSISGVGALDLNIANNGQMTMSGNYDINKGNYSLSLYNLVKREFELEPGSSVIWRGGDPLDAELNVTAKYSLETSASSLMAAQTAGSSDEVKNKYRQELPFIVYLNVKGALDQPELSFNLGMPEDSRGAIDGTVYSQIKQINTEEDALNKQVFSLLVLKKFYPNSGSDGSSGGAASLVRKNINDALSDQLNAFSERLTGNTGIQLDFGLNSYTDYQGESAEQRTDLNISAQKKLLDDRLIVEVGSNVSVEGEASSGEENPIVGNVSIQYLLTKDGRWRLKGYRNSAYENVVDGQIFVNGIALIFQRQFNRFSELFDDPVKEDETTDEPTKKNEATSDDNAKTDED